MKAIVGIDSSIAKSAILTHLEALNCDFYEFMHFLKAEIYQMNQIQTPKIARTAVSNFYIDSSKIDFTKNLCERKMLKFPRWFLATLI